MQLATFWPANGCCYLIPRTLPTARERVPTWYNISARGAMAGRRPGSAPVGGPMSALRSSIVWAAALVFAASATAARAADFYRDKTLTMIVGFAPGGGVDTTARVVARHLQRFIPGAPSIVVQNMEGAAGLVAMNYVAKRVAADGLTIAMPGRSWYVEGALHGPGVGFDVDRVSYIGSPGGVNSGLFVRTATGID